MGDIANKLAGVMLFIFGGLIRGLMSLIGELVLSVTNQLILVAQYNDFISSQAVTVGWVVVRDVANMFFIIILLVIAIATILNLESFSYKKALPKLLLMAVFINFSKTICGIIIDFGQVVMLTFVNAFKAAAGANFIQAFGLDQVMSFAAGTSDYSDAALMGTMILGLIVLLVALGTMLTLLVVLIARIIVLWILVILSPLAFLLAASPFGAEYAKEWWKNFTNYVISGPILAFFIWLSLIVAGAGVGNTQVGVVSVNPEGSTNVTAAALGTLEKLSSVIVATAMLLIGLGVTKKLGVAGSGLAGSIIDSVKKVGTAPLRATKWAAKKTASAAWNKTKQGAGAVSDIVYAKTGVALPFSERRKKAKEERRKNIHAMREAEGMARTATSMAGGRAFVASILDPRAAGKVTPWEMAKATLGGKEAQQKVQRHAGGLADASAREMRSVDPYQAQVLQNETEGRMADKRLRQERDNPEFQAVMATRDAELSAAVAAQAGDAATKDITATNLVEAQKMQQRSGASDVELRGAMVEDAARQDLSDEKDRRKRIGMPELSGAEQQSLLRRSRATHGARITLADAAMEKTTMAARLATMGIAAPVTDAQVKTAKKEKEGSQEKLEAARQSLDLFRERGTNPKAAKADAEARREDARIRGDNVEVDKINLELGELEQVVKLGDIQNFFNMSYNEQLKVALKTAEGMSESKLAKDIAEALKAGDITGAERDEVMKLWTDRDLRTARDRLNEIIEKAKKAKTP